MEYPHFSLHIANEDLIEYFSLTSDEFYEPKTQLCFHWAVYGYGLMASKLNAFNVSSGSKDWEIEIGDGYITSIISAQSKLFVIKVGDKWNILGFESTTKAHN